MVKLNSRTIQYYLLILYTFFSGVVFFEPSVGDILFIVLLPILIIHVKFKKTEFSLLALLLVPALFSFFWGFVKFGFLNFKFVFIDIYLFLLFVFFKVCLDNFYEYDRNIIDTLMKTWLAVAYLNVFTGLFSYATGRFNIMGQSIVGFGIRLIGFFKDPNVFGPFACVCGLYVFEKFYQSNKNLIFTIFNFGFMSLGVFLSFSRAAWLNYFAGLLFIVLVYSFKNKNMYKWRTLLLVFLLVFFMVMLIFSDITISGISFKEFFKGRLGIKSYDAQRFASQGKSLVMLDMSKIFGIGPGNYERITNYSAHNTYLRYMGERGFFGLITGGLLVAFITLRALKIKGKYFFLAASLIGLLVNSYFVDTLHWRHLWIVFAMIVSYSYRKEPYGES